MPELSYLIIARCAKLYEYDIKMIITPVQILVSYDRDCNNDISIILLAHLNQILYDHLCLFCECACTYMIF